MTRDVVQARLLLIRAEIHLEWLCKESRAARELVTDIQKFLTLSDSFKDSCGTVEGHGRIGGSIRAASTLAADDVAVGESSSGYQAPPAGIGISNTSKEVMPTDAPQGEPAMMADPTDGSASHISLTYGDVAETGPSSSSDFCVAGFSAKPPCPPNIQNGAVTDPGFLIARTPFAAREDRNKPPSPPVLCNPERPSIVKARKV